MLKNMHLKFICMHICLQRKSLHRECTYCEEHVKEKQTTSCEKDSIFKDLFKDKKKIPHVIHLHDLHYFIYIYKIP